MQLLQSADGGVVASQFRVLLLDPVTRTAVVRNLPRLGAGTAASVAVATGCSVPVSDLLAAGSWLGAPQPELVGAWQVYKGPDGVRGMLFCRTDMPEAGTEGREAILGFATLGNLASGSWWSGCGVVALYGAAGGDAELLRAGAVSWERSAGRRLGVPFFLSRNREGSVVCKPAVACAHCGNVNKPRACHRCFCVFYCDTICQRADWGTHKTNCKRLPALPPSQP
jgi:hypothetical protein